MLAWLVHIWGEDVYGDELVEARRENCSKHGRSMEKEEINGKYSWKDNMPFHSALEHNIYFVKSLLWMQC